MAKSDARANTPKGGNYYGSRVRAESPKPRGEIDCGLPTWTFLHFWLVSTGIPWRRARFTAVSVFKVLAFGAFLRSTVTVSQSLSDILEVFAAAAFFSPERKFM